MFPYIFLFFNGLLNDDVGRGGRGHRVSEDTARSWFHKPAIFVEGKVLWGGGGAIVEQARVSEEPCQSEISCPQK